jgi:tetratricopeptide (TPR) repeat protein
MIRHRALALLLTALLATPARAEPDYRPYAEVAARLFQAGRYETAALDYERAYVLAPAGEKAPLARHLALAHYHAGAFAKGVDALTAEPTTTPEARHTKARLLLQLQDYASADALFGEALRKDLGPDEMAADLRFLAAFNLINNNQFAEATTRFTALAGTEPAGWHQEKAGAVLQHLKGHPVHRPSPRTAMALSILPGLGQAYSGHYAEAAAAFALNGLLAYLAHDALRKSREIEGYGQSTPLLWTALFLVFYTGNFHSAAELAQDSGRQSAAEARNGAAAHGYTQILER